MTGDRKTLSLKIHNMGYGAKGVARHDGKVYFVRDAIPDDEVVAEVVSDSGRYADAQIVSITTPSPRRGTSPCPYIDHCGGCQWIHVSYEQQLEWKRQFVQSALDRIGKLEKGTQVSIRRSPEHLHYRNRIHLKLEFVHGKLHVGYFRPQSHKLVAIESCKIADEHLQPVIAFLSGMNLEQSFTDVLKMELQTFPALLAENGRGVSAVFYPERGNTEQKVAAEQIAAELRKRPEIFWADTIFHVPSNQFFPFERVGGVLLHTGIGQFQQVNLAHNTNMRAAVTAAVEAANPARILDVCCGSGNFSLLSANGTRYVEGVESNAAAIACAKHNTQVNGITNTNYIAGDATRHLWKCSKQGEKFDLIILDPPREGLYEGMIPIKNIAPQTIIYVSCDPTTLARDVGSLCKSGYRLESVEAFDFFPNTYHVETLAVLKRQ